MADVGRFRRGADPSGAGATGGAPDDARADAGAGGHADAGAAGPDPHAAAMRLGEWVGEHAPGPSTMEAPPDPAVEPAAMVVRVDTGERIHYLDWGLPRAVAAHGTPPLVLIHGLAATAWIWAPIARRLSARVHIVAPDLRGHGLSESPRSGYDLESLALDVLTVMSANGWGHDVGGPPAVVCGHGLGAMVAATMAGLRPAAVAGLALVDAGWEDVGEATGLEPAELLRDLADPPEVLRSMDAYLADRRDYDPATWDADQERAARAAVDEKHAGHVAPLTRAATMRGSVEAMLSYRPLEVLPGLAMPVLIFVAESGTADDEDRRERRLALDDVVRARLEAAVAPPRVVRFAGGGHNLMRHRPAEVSAELAGLLEVAATSVGMPGGPL